MAVRQIMPTAIQWGADLYGRGPIRPNEALISLVTPYRDPATLAWKGAESIHVNGDILQVRYFGGGTGTFYGPVSNSEAHSHGFEHVGPYLQANLDEMANRLYYALHPEEKPSTPAPQTDDSTYVFTIRFRTQLPADRLYTPVLEAIMMIEDRIGWNFGGIRIEGDTIELYGEKRGSATVLTVVAIVCGVVLGLVGLFIVRSYTVTKLAQIELQRELSEERQGIEETKQLIIKSDLPPIEKAQILDELTDYQRTVNGGGSNGGWLDRTTKVIAVAALAMALGSLRR